MTNSTNESIINITIVNNEQNKNYITMVNAIRDTLYLFIRYDVSEFRKVRKYVAAVCLHNFFYQVAKFINYNNYCMTVPVAACRTCTLTRFRYNLGNFACRVVLCTVKYSEPTYVLRHKNEIDVGWNGQ